MYRATGTHLCPCILGAEALTLRYNVNPPDRAAGLPCETIEVLDAVDARGVSRDWDALATEQGFSLDDVERAFNDAAADAWLSAREQIGASL